MSTGDPVRQQDPWRSETPRTGWYGWIVFAGIMMFVLGAFHGIIGLVGLFESDYFYVGESELMVEVDYSAWGWTHLLLGILIACAGVAVTRGATWARIVAVVVAVLSAITNLAFMSAYPLWSAIMIAVDILVIYAVTAHGDPQSLDGY
jgi:hypothetical protein